ncbi:hypothetical protein MTO96_040630 [Rhipicephalus appendiculatus]
MSSSSPYSSERSSYDWDSSDTTTSDLPSSDGRLFLVVTRERDTIGRLDLTCYSFALAFLVVTVVSMVLFAARHRRRLLNDGSLVVDSDDRDGAKGEAALREASRRQRKEEASATRSKRTRQADPSGSRKPPRKFAGDPHEDELGWKKTRATNADMGQRTDDRRHSEPMTTAGGNSTRYLPIEKYATTNVVYKFDNSDCEDNRRDDDFGNVI